MRPTSSSQKFYGVIDHKIRRECYLLWTLYLWWSQSFCMVQRQWQSKYIIKYLVIFYTPPPNQKGNVKTSPLSNFDAEAFRDMFSTLYNRIWSTANSFFRNRQEFASFLEHWPEILIFVNWQWSLGKKSSLSKNWDY